MRNNADTNDGTFMNDFYVRPCASSLMQRLKNAVGNTIDFVNENFLNVELIHDVTRCAGANAIFILWVKIVRNTYWLEEGFRHS